MTEQLYDHARDEAASIAASAGVSPHAFQELQKELDVRNVRLMGLSKNRFPTSSVQAFKILADKSSVPYSTTITDAIYHASGKVFDEAPPIADGAADVLGELGETYSIGLLTKGDESVQARRIDTSGLARHFQTIGIVSEKDETAFSRLLTELHAEPSSSWSVGNSIRSDILPALALGMSAIWIDAHVWAHERGNHEEVPPSRRLFTAERLRDVPKLIREECVSVAK